MPSLTYTVSNTPAPTQTAQVPAVLDRNVFRPGQGGPLKIAVKCTRAGRVTVKVYNMAGELVRMPFEADLLANSWTNAYWDGTNAQGSAVSAGIYFVSVQGGGIKSIRKVVLLK